jgi:PPOX class probable F420-dependent enzyme
VSLVPKTHVDLLQRPLPATLITLMPDGRPQASVVWLDDTGGVLTWNTARDRRKTKNRAADPRATLLIIDPDNQHRYLELRCDVVSISEEAAIEHRRLLDTAYLGPEHYSDADDDHSVRVIVTLDLVAAQAHG